MQNCIDEIKALEEGPQKQRLMKVVENTRAGEEADITNAYLRELQISNSTREATKKVLDDVSDPSLSTAQKVKQLRELMTYGDGMGKQNVDNVYGALANMMNDPTIAPAIATMVKAKGWRDSMIDDVFGNRLFEKDVDKIMDQFLRLVDDIDADKVFSGRSFIEMVRKQLKNPILIDQTKLYKNGGGQGEKFIEAGLAHTSASREQLEDLYNIVMKGEGFGDTTLGMQGKSIGRGLKRDIYQSMKAYDIQFHSKGDWLAFHKQFGHARVDVAFIDTLDRAAKQTAAMYMFKSMNPYKVAMNAFNKLTEGASMNWGFNGLAHTRRIIESQAGMYRGFAPDAGTFMRSSQTVVDYMLRASMMNKLEYAAFTIVVTSNPMRMSFEAANFGYGSSSWFGIKRAVEFYGQQAGSLLKRMKDTERDELLERMLISSPTREGSAMQRFTGENGLEIGQWGSTISGILDQMYYKGHIIDFAGDAEYKSIVMDNAAVFGVASRKKWADIDRFNKAKLESSGFTEADWNTLTDDMFDNIGSKIRLMNRDKVPIELYLKHYSFVSQSADVLAGRNYSKYDAFKAGKKGTGERMLADVFMSLKNFTIRQTDNTFLPLVKQLYNAYRNKSLSEAAIAAQTIFIMTAWGGVHGFMNRYLKHMVKKGEFMDIDQFMEEDDYATSGSISIGFQNGIAADLMAKYGEEIMRGIGGKNVSLTRPLSSAMDDLLDSPSGDIFSAAGGLIDIDFQDPDVWKGNAYKFAQRITPDLAPVQLYYAYMMDMSVKEVGKMLSEERSLLGLTFK